MITIKGKSFQLDGLLQKNLDKVKELIKDDWDFVFVVDGYSGTGKSNFVQFIAWYLSEGKVPLTQIVFTPEEFRKAVLSAEKYSAVIFDEAFRGLSGRSSNSIVNKSIIELLNEIRQRNLFVFVVSNSVWELDRFIRLFRMSGLFHIEIMKKEGKRIRGYWKYYERERIIAWLSNPKANTFKYPAFSSMHGKFPAGYTDEAGIYHKEGYIAGGEEYIKKKREALGYSPKKEGEDTRIKKLLHQLAILHKNLKEKGKISYIKQGKLLDINPSSIEFRLKHHFYLEDEGISPSKYMELNSEAEEVGDA